MKRLLSWAGDHIVTIGVLAVILLAIGTAVKIVLLSGEDEGRLGPGDKIVHSPRQMKTLKREAAKADRAKRRAARKQEQSKERVHYNDDGSIDAGEYDDFSGKNKTLAKAMDAAFWENDMDEAIACASKAFDSDSVELREKAVDCLAWYDVDGMVALTPFMVDPDPDIANKAIAVWTDALAHIDDDNERADIVRQMAKVMKSGSAMESMLIASGNTSDLATMQIIIDVIDCGTEEAMAAAKEHYEFMTGEEFTTLEAAEDWLYTQSDMVAEIDMDDEGDLDAISRAAGLSADQYLERLSQEAREANMDMETFVETLRRQAVENGQSLTAYLVEQEGKNSGRADGDVDAIAKAVGVTTEQYWERLEQQAAAEDMDLDTFVEALKNAAKEENMTVTDYLIEREKEIAEEGGTATEQTESDDAGQDRDEEPME